MPGNKRARHGRWLRTYHGIATLVWIAMVPVSILTGIWQRIEYVTFLSLWALVVAEWGAWQASRAETVADESNGGESNGGDGGDGRASAR